jgi:hypothetical protein
MTPSYRGLSIYCTYHCTGLFPRVIFEMFAFCRNGNGGSNEAGGLRAQADPPSKDTPPRRREASPLHQLYNDAREKSIVHFPMTLVCLDESRALALKLQ